PDRGQRARRPRRPSAEPDPDRAPPQTPPLRRGRRLGPALPGARHRVRVRVTPEQNAWVRPVLAATSTPEPTPSDRRRAAAPVEPTNGGRSVDEGSEVARRSHAGRDLLHLRARGGVLHAPQNFTPGGRVAPDTRGEAAALRREPVDRRTGDGQRVAALVRGHGVLRGLARRRAVEVLLGEAGRRGHVDARAHGDLTGRPANELALGARRDEADAVPLEQAHFPGFLGKARANPSRIVATSVGGFRSGARAPGEGNENGKN